MGLIVYLPVAEHRFKQRITAQILFQVQAAYQLFKGIVLMIQSGGQRLLDYLQKFRKRSLGSHGQLQGNRIYKRADDMLQIRMLSAGYRGADDDRLLLADLKKNHCIKRQQPHI
ncbi:hypothetical protein D3C86_1824190 [compost metagenome]